MKTSKIYNFIIYIFLLVSIVSVIGAGFEEPHLASMHFDNGNVMQCFVETELLPEDNVTNIRVVERSSSLSRVSRTRTTRSALSNRTAFYILCALAVLSGLFLFTNQERFLLFRNRYVLRISYQVVYIEDQDGSKRIS